MYTFRPSEKTPQDMSVAPTPFAVVPGRSGSSARFYLADCLEVFAELAPDSVDVIVTSPPYNIGIRYSSYQDTLSPAEYLEWTDDLGGGRRPRAAARTGRCS